MIDAMNHLVEVIACMVMVCKTAPEDGKNDQGYRRVDICIFGGCGKKCVFLHDPKPLAWLYLRLSMNGCNLT